MRASVISVDQATQFIASVRAQFELEGEHQREGATKISRARFWKISQQFSSEGEEGKGRPNSSAERVIQVVHVSQLNRASFYKGFI